MKCNEQTISVPSATISSFPYSVFPSEANSATEKTVSPVKDFTPFWCHSAKFRRQGELQQTRSTTKQNFSVEVLSKQLTEASLTSLSCNLSRVPTKWSAIFARSILLLFICYLRAICDENTNIFWVRNERVGQSRSCSPAMYIDCCTSYRKKKVCESNFVLKFSLLIFIHICNDS